MPAKQPSVNDAGQIDQLTLLWILRILVPPGGHKVFINRSGFTNDAVARALGLGAWLDDDDLDFDPKAIRIRLRQMHRQAEQRAAAARAPATLGTNMVRLASLVGLSGTDCRILEFATMIQQDRRLDDCADSLGMLNSLKVIDVLAQLLGLGTAEVRASLGPHGVLARSGLLAIERSGSGFLRGRLDVLSDEFANHILSYDADPVSLLRDTISPSQPARLGLEDYGHIGDALALLEPYLESALADGRAGANVFIHGAPGTGKSELARTLAAKPGCELFDVASEDSDGDPVSDERRLRAYRAAKSFFSQRKAMILFDEVEDVFSDGNHLSGHRSTAQRRKAWFNRSLEQNRVPTLWLSNSIEGIDPAFMRRFDFVIEMPVPPRAQRERIVRAACEGLLDETLVRRLAEAGDLAPAVIHRAASVARAIHAPAGATDTAGALLYLVDQSLQAQGLATLRQTDAGCLPDGYDASLVNADSDLLQLADGLERARSGRLCLYGPPGTGKTAYGRWLAGRLGMPLLVYTASAADLQMGWRKREKHCRCISPGRIRKRAAADRRGRQLPAGPHPCAALLGDHDGQRNADADGIVPGYLHRIDQPRQRLGPCRMRRFDLRVCFGFLLPAQSATLLASHCASLALAAPGAAELGRARGLRSATPGDFAAVARRHRFAAIATPEAFINAVEAECAPRRRTSPAIGFVQ